MKRKAIRILVVCIFCLWLSGCSATTRAFWAGAAVTAATVYEFCHHCHTHVIDHCH